MRYPGGKNGGGAYQTIINQIPPHRTFIEPFLGSGPVMRFKRPAAWSIGIDINPAVVDAFDCETRLAGEVDGSGCNLRRPQIDLAAVDGIAFLESYDWRGDEFVYCDPPYLLSTRSRKAKRIYLHELTERDHKRLLEILKNGCDRWLLVEALRARIEAVAIHHLSIDDSRWNGQDRISVDELSRADCASRLPLSRIE